jgi:hypothetical protein
MMSESEVITLGWCYEMAKGDRAKALRQQFNTFLKELTTTETRQWYIHLFNTGRHEARSN